MLRGLQAPGRRWSWRGGGAGEPAANILFVYGFGCCIAGQPLGHRARPDRHRCGLPRRNPAQCSDRRCRCDPIVSASWHRLGRHTAVRTHPVAARRLVLAVAVPPARDRSWRPYQVSFACGLSSPGLDALAIAGQASSAGCLAREPWPRLGRPPTGCWCGAGAGVVSASRSCCRPHGAGPLFTDDAAVQAVLLPALVASPFCSWSPDQVPVRRRAHRRR